MALARQSEEILVKWLEEAQGKKVKSLRLGFRASHHGCTFANLHSLLDNKGPVLFVMKSEGFGKTFGGYVPVAFSVNEKNSFLMKDMRSFIFSLDS